MQGYVPSLVMSYLPDDLAQTSSLYVLLQAAACRRMVGDIKEAAEVYEHGKSCYRSL